MFIPAVLFFFALIAIYVLLLIEPFEVAEKHELLREKQMEWHDRHVMHKK